MKNILAALLLITTVSFGQNQPMASEDVTSNFICMLEDVKNFPDKQIEDALKAALLKEESPLKVRLDPNHDIFSENWIGTASKMINSLLVQNTLLLPQNFFAASRCEQMLVIELSGSMLLYAQELMLADPSSAKTVGWITGQMSETKMRTIVRINPIAAAKLISETLTALENLAVRKTDNLADIVFGSCSAAEAQGIFLIPTTDKKVWVETLRENINENLKTIKQNLGI